MEYKKPKIQSTPKKCINDKNKISFDEKIGIIISEKGTSLENVPSYTCVSGQIGVVIKKTKW